MRHPGVEKGRRSGAAAVAWTLGLAFLCPVAARAEVEDLPSARELRTLSLEQLAELEVTTVSRRVERLQTTPAAVSVIMPEDIRRGGASTIPEALRMATGVHVARSSSTGYAISTRGFATTTANKLQVVMDGRSLYSPLFSGVFWDVQETLMEDVARIEVIRGPGATMWGANAVNGVINILTKDARDTQGTLVTAAGGVGVELFASVRHGAQLGENAWFRVYARGWERDDIVLPDGSDPDERRLFAQTGFRADGAPTPDNHWTLQGDFYNGRFDRMEEEPTEVSGGNAIGRWTHLYDDGGSAWIQAYYDRTERTIPALGAERRNTGDLEMQRRFFLGDRHDFLAGLNVRVSADRIENTPALAFIPARETIRLYSAFIQDRILLVEDSLDLTLGSKFEYNSYSDFEYQPSARISWRAAPRHTVWGAVSRAVRTPTRIDMDFFSPNPEFGELQLRGSRNFDSENLWAYEAGYRLQPRDDLTLDLALFYHDYSNLRSREPQPDGGPPLVFSNELEGETYGFELSATAQLSEWWRVTGGYTNLQKRLRLKAGSNDPTGGAPEGNDPEHILVFRSSMNIGRAGEFDAILRHVDELPSPPVPAYTELDLRLGWRFNPELEAAIIGRNLLHSHHAEFGTTREVARTVYAKLTWNF